VNWFAARRSRTLRQVARVVVDVMLKPEIHDPQGEAIASACRRLGFGQILGVRQGKRFEVEIRGPADDAAVTQIAELAAELLANPVIEEFEVRAMPGRIYGARTAGNACRARETPAAHRIRAMRAGANALAGGRNPHCSSSNHLSS
jgi:phosphoribosylformylglycinamidine synthase PurS subunit